jgi:cobyrinic acid a,c-diamide synthase
VPSRETWHTDSAGEIAKMIVCDVPSVIEAHPLSVSAAAIAVALMRMDFLDM